MKFICNQSDLTTNLSLVTRAVPSRPTHPVLANVLLKANTETQQVSLTAFDLSLGIQTSFAATILEAGQFTLPARLLGDIVSRLPDGEITLQVAQDEADDEETGIATLTASSGRYEMRGIGARDFPELPTVEDGTTLHLPVDSLAEGLRGTLFATSSDETKQVLTGVHLTLFADRLEFAATDGHRLAVVYTSNSEDIKELETDEPLELTIPARALRELEKILFLLQSEGAIALHFDTTQIVFHGMEHRLTTRTLEGQYPNYRQLIPRQFLRTVTVDRKLLMTSVERIAVLADQKNNIVRFNLHSDRQELSLSVEAADVGSGCEAISAQISGEDLEIGFNVKYLLEGLKVLQSSEVQVQLNTNLSPVIINPLGGNQMTYLIMPVQIRK